MRNLTKVAIAFVLVATTFGLLHPVGGGNRDIAVRTNNRIERQLISQGAGQNDQNLKLLLAAKIFEGGGSVPARKDHADPGGRASSIVSHGKPTS
jgi:hypothetical protein